MQIEPGTSLAHYEITAPLGKGGMGPRFLPDGSGIVYETFDVRAKVDLATIGLEEGATPRVFLESMLAVRSIAPANTGVVVVENWRSELD